MRSPLACLLAAAPALPLLAWTPAPAPAQQTAPAVRSVYTSLATEDCRLLRKDPETGGTVQRCPGVAGYALEVSDYDARMSITVVAPNGSRHPLRYTSAITSSFSSLGPRAEWRVTTRGQLRRPLALIVRVNAFEDPARPERATSYLAVARVARTGSCVTHRIGPVADANAVARQAADRASLRPCLDAARR